VIADEIYELFNFAGVKIYSIASFPRYVRPDDYVNGIFQRLAMTAGRVEYLSTFIHAKAVEKIASQFTSGGTVSTACRLWQVSQAIRPPVQKENGWMALLRRRRTASLDLLQDIPAKSKLMSQKGILFSFPEVTALSL